MQLLILLTATLLLRLVLGAPHPEDALIVPGTLPIDTMGRQVHAHGGGILQLGERYWWYGTTQKQGPDWISEGINLYASEDLASWEYTGQIFSGSQIQGMLYPAPYRIERPKILYNKEFDQFVMLFHCDTPSFAYPAVGMASAPVITGPWTWEHVFQPHGRASYDMTAYQDEDGSAYLVNSVENNLLGISKLTKDYLDVERAPCGPITQAGHPGEAPAVFKTGADSYYVVASHLTGWKANAPILFHSQVESLCKGEWEELPCPARGPGADTTFQSQSTFVLPITFSDGARLFIYMADRWNFEGPGSVGNASYVWLPLAAQIEPERREDEEDKQNLPVGLDREATNGAKVNMPQPEALYATCDGTHLQPQDSLSTVSRPSSSFQSLSRPGSATSTEFTQDSHERRDSLDFQQDRADPKKQICFDFTKGVCTRGANCKYSHDIALIVSVNSQERGICFDFLRGQCNRGLLCRFSHDLSNIAAQQSQINKTSKRNAPICYDFVKGLCMRGADCRYSHDINSIINGSRSAGNTSYEICYDFSRGRCTRGAACRYSHDIRLLAQGGVLSPALMAAGLAGPAAIAAAQAHQATYAAAAAAAASRAQLAGYAAALASAPRRQSAPGDLQQPNGGLLFNGFANRAALMAGQYAASIQQGMGMMHPDMAAYNEMMAYGRTSPPGMMHPAWAAMQQAAARSCSPDLPHSAAMQAPIPARRHTDDGTGGTQAYMELLQQMQAASLNGGVHMQGGDAKINEKMMAGAYNARQPGMPTNGTAAAAHLQPTGEPRHVSSPINQPQPDAQLHAGLLNQPLSAQQLAQYQHIIAHKAALSAANTALEAVPENDVPDMKIGAVWDQTAVMQAMQLQQALQKQQQQQSQDGGRLSVQPGMRVAKPAAGSENAQPNILLATSPPDSDAEACVPKASATQQLYMCREIWNR
ncbi:hypothetical protein WJX72_009862 [[Myrmecia] bisecta]|uniref:C3H1-type domain-containing protein n=1 Tax=[Myrmecia] bisecta TaxID=41462 RepID=A0AAW1PYK4_9CHLO